MSSSSVVVLKRTEVEPEDDWYVDLDQYLEPQRNLTGAAARLGLKRTTLVGKIRKSGLSREMAHGAI